MLINCFRSPRGASADVDEAPRPVKSKKGLKRQGTSQSTASTLSHCSSTSTNSSISKLPPCKQMSDSAIEAMMMPVPPEPRPSRCLRLSQPKTYSDIVYSMKIERGCRDWRSFDVFCSDEIDMNTSADAIARRKAADCEKRLLRFGGGSNESADETATDRFVDMIG